MLIRQYIEELWYNGANEIKLDRIWEAMTSDDRWFIESRGLYHGKG